MAGWDKKLAEKTQRVVGAYQEKIDGAAQKVETKVGNAVNTVVDGVTQKVTQTVGGAVRTVDGVAGQINEQANFIRQKTLLASSAITGAMHQINSGLLSVSTHPAMIEVGTQVAGMAFSGAVIIKPGGVCLDLGKLVKDIMKLLELLQDVFGELDTFEVPGFSGIGGYIERLTNLGKVIVPCLDISTAMTASINGTAVTGSSGPGDLSQPSPNN